MKIDYGFADIFLYTTVSQNIRRSLNTDAPGIFSHADILNAKKQKPMLVALAARRNDAACVLSPQPVADQTGV